MHNLATHALRLLAGILLFLPLTASGQLILTPQIGVGIATQGWRFDGETYRQAIDPDADESAGIRPRIIGELGAVGTFPLNDQIGVTGGLILQQRGSSWYYANQTDIGKFVSRNQFSFYYLAIPIGVVYAPEELTEGLRLEAGFIPAFAVSGRVKRISSLDGDRELLDTDKIFGDDDDFNRGDFRFFGGARFKPEDLPVEVGARLELGVSGNHDDPDLRMANHAITIFVGFPLEVAD